MEKIFERKTGITSNGLVRVLVRMDGKIAEACGFSQGEATAIALNVIRGFEQKE